MRLAMLYDYPFQSDAGAWYTHRAYGRYIDSLAPHFSSLVVFAPALPRRSASLAYRIRAANVSLVRMPYFDRWHRSLPALAWTPAALWRHRAAFDALYVRMPCPLAASAYPAARWLRKPLCLHIVGDLLAQMADYPLALRFPARLIAVMFDAFTRHMARQALTITQGSPLARRYGAGRGEVFSVLESTVSERDIWVRRDVAAQRPARILYVGALLPKKGVFDLLRAFAELRNRLDAVLTVAGAGPGRSDLERLCRELKLGEAVEFCGEVASDEALAQLYRRADVFVLPSLAEGVPRVLLEAMANSVPVVATAVGGVPDLVTPGHNGLLVEPQRVDALAEAIHRAASDLALRARFIQGGIETARHHTREAHARTLARLLRKRAGEPVTEPVLPAGANRTAETELAVAKPEESAARAEGR